MSMIRGDFRPPPMKYIKGLRDLFKETSMPTMHTLRGRVLPTRVMYDGEKYVKVKDLESIMGDEDVKKLLDMTEEDVERMKSQKQSVPFEGTILQVNRYETAYNILIHGLLKLLTEDDVPRPKETISAIMARAAGELS